MGNLTVWVKTQPLTNCVWQGVAWLLSSVGVAFISFSGLCQKKKKNIESLLFRTDEQIGSVMLEQQFGFFMHKTEKIKVSATNVCLMNSSKLRYHSIDIYQMG